MRINIKDIDPHIAQTIDQYINSHRGIASWKTDDDKILRHSLLKRKFDLQRRYRNRYLKITAGFSAFFALSAFILYQFAFHDGGRPIDGSARYLLYLVSVWSLGIIMFAGFMVCAYNSSRTFIHLLLHGAITNTELRALLPSLTLSDAEKLYFDTLISLTDPKSSIDEQAGRNLLRQLNLLMENLRELDTRPQTIQAGINAHPVRLLETQRDQLLLQLAQSADPIARQAIQQNIQMCEVRIRNAHSFIVALERLDVQKAVLLQTLASTQSSLSNALIMPSTPNAMEINDLQEAITRINVQTQSIEQATQEVIMIR